MVNQYLVSIPVKKWEEALLLGSETNWIILKTLGRAGVEGLTVKEISDKTGIPKSTIYNFLRALLRTDLIKSRSVRQPKWGAPNKEDIDRQKRTEKLRGKHARLYFENIEWGNFKFEPNFYDSIRPILPEYKDKLKQQWLDVLEEMIVLFKTDEELKKFFPTEKRICEYCNWSHEAGDFLRALNIGLLIAMFEDEDFYKLAEKYSFANSER